MTIDRLELLRIGLRLIDVAREANVSYAKIHRASAGMPLRDEDEAERVREVIRHRTEGAATPVA